MVAVMTESTCEILARIERLWPNLRRSAQRQLCKDADLCCYGTRNMDDIYNMSSKTKLTPAGELQRIRDRWPKIDAKYREQLGRQAESHYRGF